MQIPLHLYPQLHAMKAALELQPSSAKIMKSDILNVIKHSALYLWLEIRKNNVFTRSYLCSRGFFGSNISSDYSVAWRGILNYGRRLLCLTKPTLVTITRCWCRWSRFCNAFNIYLSCSCWCECSLTRFSIPTRGFTTEPSMKEATTMLELIVFSSSLRASVVRASEWAL